MTGKNAIANLVGNLAVPMTGLVMTPFYLKKIGLEGLGLIGLMTLVTTVLGVFVAGTSKTYQRDLSAAHTSAPQDVRGLVSGGMLFFTLLGVGLGISVQLIGQQHIPRIMEGTSFSHDTVARCLWVISLLLCFGFVSGAIVSSLVALRDQVWPQSAIVFTTIATAIATWLALEQAPSVEVFYYCQLGGSLGAVLLLTDRCRTMVRRITGLNRPTSMKLVWKARVAASGKLSMLLVIHEGIGMLITQIDRLLVTSRFPVSALGAYNLAAGPARFAAIFTNPVVTVTYPELCGLVSSSATRTTAGEYLGRVTFILILLLGTGMIVLVPSAQSLLNLWLGTGQFPSETAACLVLLGCGQLLQAAAGPAYNLTVAHGRVGYAIPKNIVSLILLPIIGVGAVKIWGLPGIAALGIVYGAISFLVCSVVAYRRHADFRSALRWMGGMSVSLVTAAFLAVLLCASGLQGWSIIFLSALSAFMFSVFFLMRYFGCRPSAWLDSLEAIPRPAGQAFIV